MRMQDAESINSSSDSSTSDSQSNVAFSADDNNVLTSRNLPQTSLEARRR